MIYYTGLIGIEFILLVFLLKIFSVFIRALKQKTKQKNIDVIDNTNAIAI